jgi:thymidylate kinase
VVVALSGLDGAGKSSQAQRLASRLEEAGHTPAVHWMALGHSRLQRRLRRLIRKVRSRGARSPAAGHDSHSMHGRGDRRTPHHPLLAHAWVTLLAAIYGMHFRRVARSHRGDVLIFDRYTLDAIAQSRYFYSPQSDFRLARAILRILAPRPDHSYLLAVAPEVALARKQEQYDAGQLRLLADLLADEARRMRVHVLDGDREAGELSDALVADTLSALSTR